MKYQFKTRIQLRIEKLEKHKDVINNPSLRKQIGGLKNNYLNDEKISRQYDAAFCYMADGIEYHQAMEMAGLMKGHE